MEPLGSPLNSKDGSQKDQLVGKAQDAASRDRDLLQHLGGSPRELHIPRNLRGKPQRARLCCQPHPGKGLRLQRGPFLLENPPGSAGASLGIGSGVGWAAL